MDKDLFERLKNSNSDDLYEQAKKLCSSLGISPEMMSGIIASPEDLQRKLSAMSYEDINRLSSSLDSKTLSEIEKSIRKNGGQNGN